MGRRRIFDTDTVLDAAARVFRRHGYEGTSVDLLVEATGVHRGSLYGVFGSKLGLFVDALRRCTGKPAESGRDGAQAGGDELATDMLLVALMDLTATDPLVAEITRSALADRALTPADLGERLLARGGLDPREGSR